MKAQTKWLARWAAAALGALCALAGAVPGRRAPAGVPQEARWRTVGDPASPPLMREIDAQAARFGVVRRYGSTVEYVDRIPADACAEHYGDSFAVVDYARVGEDAQL